MASPRALLLAALLVATPALAGCNVKDWYNKEGTVKVNLMPIGPAGTNLSEFSVLKVAIYSVSLRQLETVDPREYSFAPAQVVDLVAAGKSGERIPLVVDKFNARAVQQVIVRLDVTDALDAAGNRVPVCHPGDVNVQHPCLSIPANGAFIFDEKPFSPPRGGTATFNFPLAVKFERNPDPEWFLQNDPALIAIDTAR